MVISPEAVEVNLAIFEGEVNVLVVDSTTHARSDIFLYMMQVFVIIAIILNHLLVILLTLVNVRHPPIHQGLPHP